MENEINGCKRTNLSKVGRYYLSRTIGRGNFAVVKLGKHEITKTKVAVKIIDKCRLKVEDLRKIHREINILKFIKHRHIIRLYQVMETDTKLFLVTEYASGGEVFEYLRKHNRMNEREGRQVFRQVASAVAYCHASGVVHRDLKAENLLFSTKNSIKLVDFGFSNFYNDGCLLQTWCGSPPYAAPELFLGENYDGAKADIWSLGVVLYILVCGGFPFPSTSIERLRQAVLEGHINIPFYVSAECADLIRKMLVVDPKQRYNVKQVIQHRWFSADDWTEELDVLFRTSLDPKSALETPTLNHSCIIYMQQRGYSAEKITESVVENMFDDEYATYHLLYDKLIKRDLPIFNANFANCADLVNGVGSGGGSRRGSRGSITTGQVNTESFNDTPTISTADLVKLGLSSGDEDSVSSDSEGSGSAAPSTINMQKYLAQRRHTALGVPGLNVPMFAQPSASGNVGVVPPVTFPLVGNLGELSNLANPLMSLLKPPSLFLPNMHSRNYHRTDSYGNSTKPMPRSFIDPFLLGAGPLKSYNNYEQPSSSSMSSMIPSTATNEENGVEEMGARYLKAKGNLKRHTVHGTGDSPTRAAGLSGGSGRHYSPIGGFYQTTRTRGDPYRSTSANRRGSDSTQLTPDMLRHLERLYWNSATQGSESPSVVDNMRHLQQEFQQLKATTEMLQSSNSDLWRSPRASPPNQCLGMIAEHDNDEGQQQLYSTPNLAQFLPSSTSLPATAETTPQISVTDDLGTTFIHHRVPLVDPLMGFQMFSNDLLRDVPCLPTTFDKNYYYTYQPPPIINSTSNNNEKTTPTTIYSNGLDSILSSRTMPDVCAQLESVLNSMTNVICQNVVDDLGSTEVATAANASATCYQSSRRVSLQSNDGTRIEIGVTPIDYQSGGLCCVEFRCVEGDRNRCETLCTQVLAGLSL